VRQRWNTLKDAWHVGKSIVAVAVLVGLLAVAQLLLFTDTSFYSAVWKAVALAFLVMAALGVGERLWKKAKIKEAGVGPDGANLTFEDAIADSVATVNERVDSHVEDINKRLYDLEKAVFKNEAPSNDG